MKPIIVITFLTFVAGSLSFLLGMYHNNLRACFYAQGVQDTLNFYVDTNGNPLIHKDPLSGDIDACDFVGESLTPQPPQP